MTEQVSMPVVGAERRKKKEKVFTVSFLIAALLALWSFGISWWGTYLTSAQMMSIILIIQLILVLWVLDFDLRIWEMFHFSFPPSLFILVSLLSLKSLPLAWEQVAAIVVFTSGEYILLSTLNIINVSTVRPVPLKKVALSSLFFIGMVVMFMLGLILSQNGWGLDYNLAMFWLCISCFGFNFLYLGADDNNNHYLESFLYSLIAAELLVCINFWPATIFSSILAVVGWLFIWLGLFHYQINKNLKRSTIKEYLIISGLLLMVYLWL
jgi:hypothetical protein